MRIPTRIDPKLMKKGRTAKTSSLMALCSLTCALSVVIMYLGAIIDVLDLTTAALASLLCIIVIFEAGGAYPWLVYAVTSVLSLLLLPQKFGALVYTFLAGVYPSLKCIFERCKSRIVEWVLKLAYFNLAMLLLVLTAALVLSLPEITRGYIIALFALGNFTFVIYDILLSMLIFLYISKYRKLFRIDRLLK